MFDIENIKDPSFIKRLSTKEKKILADEIREFLIKKISKTGGHLASNLGVVELTIALHSCFESPKDIMIFDVSHQSYVHKILTGRGKHFDTLRQFGGLSGYSSRAESEHDFFETGHSSTSISAMSGILLAHKLEGRKDYVVSVIGDASFGNGMVFEALNFMGEKDFNKGIIILNDNKMGISKNVGSLSKMLNRLRKSWLFSHFKSFIEIIFPSFMIMFFKRIVRGIKGFIQKANIFEDMGFNYLGPIDGHNLVQLEKNIMMAKRYHKPTVIHVVTKKGKGFEKAEQDIEGTFHGVAPNFDLNIPSDQNFISFSEAIIKALIELSEKEKIYVISSAMIKGSKLDLFQKVYPERLFDVGIAEEHAATMAAGLSICRKNVFLSYYSTFSQRAYDQINHDIVRQKLPVVIGLDRAGIVGEDGITHQGVFDLALFSHLDDVIISSPSNIQDCYFLMNLAYRSAKPFFIRYEKDLTERKEVNRYFDKLDYSWPLVTSGKRIVLVSYGSTVKRLVELNKKYQLEAYIFNARIIKPLDSDCLSRIFMLDIPVFVIEEVIEEGSLYSMILRFLAERKLASNKLYRKNFQTGFIEHGDKLNLLKKHGLDNETIYQYIKSKE